MVIVFVALTILAFLAVDYVLRREERKEKDMEKSIKSPIFLSPEKALHRIGDENKRLFHLSHTWAMPSDDGYVYVGFDKFITHIYTSELQIENMPLIGSHVPQGAQIWDLYFGPRKITQLSPVSGKVIGINPACHINVPLQADKVEQSWILKIKPDNLKTESLQLMNYQQAKLINTALRDEFYLYAQRGSYLNDGGQFDARFLETMSNGDWVDLVQRFFPYHKD